MFRALLMILDLDGYRSLWCKYHDRSGLTYGERKWTSDVWRTVMWEMLRKCQIRLAWNIRAAWYQNDWQTLFEMVLEWWQIEDIAEITNYA